VCGLSMGERQPYCWGNNIYVEAGVPAVGDKRYAALSAGDNHLCALRQSYSAASGVVDCWGYNMTGSFVAAPLVSITSGSFFTCGLFAANSTPVCWGDETGSGAISTAPAALAFASITAGGYHVCGILQRSRRTLCWGRSLDANAAVPKDALFTSLVAGKFVTCGLRNGTDLPSCWGLTLPNTRPMPATIPFSTLVAGDYFICGMPIAALPPQCWGSGYPVTFPAPGMCSALPCSPGTYSLSPDAVKTLALCPNPNDNVCIPCSEECPKGLIQSSPCSPSADRQCSYDCSHCHNNSCVAACTTNTRSESIQIPIIIGELVTAVVVIGVLLMVAFFCVRRKVTKPGSSVRRKPVVMTTKVMKETKARARCFTYKELDDATGGFAEGAEIGRGSFACVFKGVLSDGSLVAVKRPVVADSSYNFHEFTNEIDLLSRLNHAHLLNLLGYCNERGERLLVYEYMENGTLFEHLHGREQQQLSWVTRVRIAVQAARGLEYLHGYACPPVIHRDIKSANILLDDEWNARVADFGLSLLGPSDESALSELPAGTLGYLDPEYYRLHYLTTKSDVYSFGVMLVEILTGRMAVDEGYESLVDWAVPLIKKGEVVPILDPRLAHPPDPEGLLRIARVAARCVRARGKDRPSMDRVTTSLERSLALLMGTGQLILPSEVVLGSNRLHPKSKSSRSHLSSALTADSSWQALEPEHQSIASSRIQQRWPSESDDEHGAFVPEPDAGMKLSVVLSPTQAPKGSEIAPASPKPARS
jgi:serine/threonine protein kinase